MLSMRSMNVNSWDLWNSDDNIHDGDRICVYRFLTVGTMEDAGM